MRACIYLCSISVGVYVLIVVLHSHTSLQCMITCTLQIADSSVLRDHAWPAWNTSPDYKPPRRFVRSRLQQLYNSEESLAEESPELEKLRQTMESWETQSKTWCFNGPQLEQHQQQSSQVRLPVPDSIYNEIGNEDEDENWATNLVRPSMGQFYALENSPIPKMHGVQNETQDSPLTRSELSEQEQLESSSDEAVATQGSMSQDCLSSRRSRSYSDVSRPFSLHQYALKLQAKKNMRRVSEGVMKEPEMIPAKLENNPHLVPGAEEVMERVLKWDKSIGEWAFDGMKEGYSPKVEPKRNRRRSREVHFPAPDSAYEPFLSDDESWQAVLQASVKPGKFLNTSPIIRPVKDINHDDDATSEDCPQSTAPPEETEEEPEPPEERKKDAVGEVPTKTAEDDDVTCSVQKVSTKVVERAKLFGGVKRAKSFSVKRSASHLATCSVDRRVCGSQDDSIMSTTFNVSQEPTIDSAQLQPWSASTPVEGDHSANENSMPASSANDHNHATRVVPTETEQPKQYVHSVTVQVTRFA